MLARLFLIAIGVTGTLAAPDNAPPPFSGYQLYPSTNIPTTLAGNTVMNLGEFAAKIFTEPNPAPQFACDATPECQFHDGVFNLKGWSTTSPSNTTHSYISVTKCGDPSRKGTNITSSCSAPASAPGYFSCPLGTGESAGLVKIATFQLPPFLVAQSCDKNDDCVAFTIDYGT